MSLRSRNAHGQVRRAILCGNLQDNAEPQARKSHFAWKLTGKKAGPQFRGARLVRACAGETHMDIPEEPFCAEIYRKNAGPPGEHLD